MKWPEQPHFTPSPQSPNDPSNQPPHESYSFLPDTKKNPLFWAVILARELTKEVGSPSSILVAAEPREGLTWGLLNLFTEFYSLNERIDMLSC